MKSVKKPKVLIVDDTPENIQVLMEALKDQYTIVAAINGDKAIKMAAADPRPDLMLLDIMMPDMDGYEVCRRIKADEKTKDIPVIFVTAKTEVDDETRGFEIGAVDYITKPFSIPVVRARVKAHLELKRLRDVEVVQRAKLEALLEKLNAGLTEAADYARFLLPNPTSDEQMRIDWRFMPSAALGGDALGYHWLDDDCLAVYLIDVCGHGVGAALHSVSVLNVIRSGNLQNTDFHRPEQVLAGLNAVFPMEQHKDMFFTIWYGVYNRSSRLLTYAGGGHPPALLMIDEPGRAMVRTIKLFTPNLAIGVLADADFVFEEVSINHPAGLYVFSDGVYEIPLDGGKWWEYDDLSAYLEASGTTGKPILDDLTAHVMKMAGTDTLEDDFSVLEIFIN